MNKFFKEINKLGTDCFAVSKFISVCFTIRGEEKNSIFGSQSGYDSTSDEISSKGILLVCQNFSDFDVRRTISDIGRCFCANSVAGGALRDENSIPQAVPLRTALVSFANCQHENQRNNQNTLGMKICNSCTSNLDSVSRAVEEKISSASRLDSAFTDAVQYSYESNLRNLSMATAEVIKSAIQARQTYFTLFDAKRGSDVIDYETKYRNIADSSVVGGEYWLCDAQRTGEIFPGRPEIRPRISFGANNQMKNAKTCRKTY